MTNAEIIQAIRAEIQRISSRAMNEAGQDLCEYFLSFLSNLEKSLPAKVADGDGLNGEIESYFEGWSDDSEYGQAVMRDGACAGVDECKDIAHHFYDLGCRRTAEKYDEIEYNRQRASGSSEIPKDLEEAAEKYFEENKYEGENCWECDAIESFIAGTKWQKEQYHFFNKAWTENMQAELDKNYENGKQAMKEQMMKDAIEAVARPWDKEIWCDLDKFPELKDGDDIQIIIIKKGDK